MNFETLREIVVAVKPSAGSDEIKPTDSLIDDLGLDSLDMLQLQRKVQRAAKVVFVLELWTTAERAKTGPRFTFESLLAHLSELAAAQAT